MSYIVPCFGDENVVSTVANQVVVFRTTIPWTIEFTYYATHINTSEVGSFFGLGFYYLDGHLMSRSEPMPTDVAGVIKVSAYAGRTTIAAGEYYWAWTCSSAVPDVVALAEQPGLISLLNYDLTRPGYGPASSPSVGGVLPSILGTVTTDTSPIAIGLLI